MRKITKGILGALVVTLLLAAGVSAKPKSHEFNVPAEDVYQAAYKYAREHHRVNFTDEKNLVFEFHTGTSLASWGFDCNVSIERTKSGAILILNVQKTKQQLLAWGAGDRMAEKFFKGVEGELSHEEKK
jgi:hypothetical protein